MRLLICLLVCLSANVMLAQQNTYSRAKVLLNEQSAFALQRIGLDLTHGQYAAGRFYINDFSQEEIRKIRAVGYEVEVLIEDVQAFYISQNHERTVNEVDCINEVGASNTPVYETPLNYENGSMSGFFTHEEMLEELDSMHAKYPDLITARMPIEGQGSYEGRPIYWLRLSDAAAIDEDEPEVLYTALHHAREPGSLSQMIFYLWYLLENYETDEQVQFLVNNTEMYFIPCINPDGYIYNETTNPEGGGLWRKNRRANADGSFGVDLNRNYGFEWGFDDNGSSPNPESQTYHGTAGFSEPETQAVSAFCNAHEFQLALNYHTFGNLLIYPWGYLDTPTEDGATFELIAEALTIENNYLAGTGTETVGYVSNGVSDDWMYGETQSKPFIYSFTPEVGNGGFWPVESQIVEDNKNCMRQNLMLASLLFNYGTVMETGGATLADVEGDFYYQLKRYGLSDGLFTISLEAVSDNIVSVGPAKTYMPEPGEAIDDFISYTLDPDIQSEELIVFRLSIDNGDYVQSQIIEKRFGNSVPEFYSDGSSLDAWQNENSPAWSVTNESFVSAPNSITDSPFSNYGSNINSSIGMQDFVPFENAEKVLLNFWARWEIESNYDYVQLQIQLEEGGDYFPVCGKYTVEGSEFQDEGKPVYEGSSGWVQEDIDLTAFAEMGEQFRLRFVLVSDQFIEGDGFYFDDFAINLIGNEITNTTTLSRADFRFSQNRPNPAKDFTQINLEWGELPVGQDIELTVYNQLGQKVWEEKISYGTSQQEINTKSWPAGTYSYRIQLNEYIWPAKRMTVIK